MEKGTLRELPLVNYSQVIAAHLEIPTSHNGTPVADPSTQAPDQPSLDKDVLSHTGVDVVVAKDTPIKPGWHFAGW